jgi:hypothetical protein
VDFRERKRRRPQVPGTNFDCSGGQFFNPNRRALNLQLASVKGQITFASWTVRMGAPEGTAPVPFRSEGTIRLTNARAGTFQDERALWPKRGDLLLDGFVYGSFGPGCPTAAADRLEWLALDTTAGVQRYQQLAKLGQADKWQPDPRPTAPPLARMARWALWVQVVIGWILATLFVAGISGLIRRL